jgi:hypothetical protein
MNFLLPTALLALFALALPLLIHLSRRSQQHRTDFAALRWLQARFRPRRQPIVQEWLLLLIRLLLLTAVVLFLAVPVRQHTPAPAHWLVAVPGVAWPPDEALPSGNAVSRHWLAPGFPEADRPLPPMAVPVASLLRELDAKLPATTRLTVLVPERIRGLDAERPQLQRPVQWQTVQGQMPAHTSPALVPAMAITPNPVNAESARYFRAAYRVWQSHLPETRQSTLPVLAGDAVPSAPVRIWVYLPAGPVPAPVLAWSRKGGTLMLGPDAVIDAPAASVLWRADDGNALVKQHAIGSGRVLQWQQALDGRRVPQLRDSGFPEHLRNLLEAVPVPDSGMAQTQRPRIGASPSIPEPQPLQPWLLIAVVLLFLVERIVATRPSRGMPA